MIVEVKRHLDAPIGEVFARLIDLPGYSEWLPEESFSRRSELTSDDPIGAGTTYIDKTKGGGYVGEITELEEPTRVVFRQRLSVLGVSIEEALQTNVLEAVAGGTTVRHRWEGRSFGPLRLVYNLGRRSTVKERNLVFDALKSSFEQ